MTVIAKYFFKQAKKIVIIFENYLNHIQMALAEFN